MSKKRRSVVGKGTPRPDLFQGEVMECKVCGKREQSDPEKESGWTVLQIDDQVTYFCPACWHGAGAKVGYAEVMKLAVLMQTDGRALRIFRSLLRG